MAKNTRVRTDDKQTDHDGSFLEEMTEGMSIDKHALDEALTMQVHNFHKVSERLAIDISIRDMQKDEAKRIEAEADEEIRRMAEEEEKKKPSETAIRNLVMQDKAVVSANKELARLNKSVGLLQALKESYLQRSYALKELVSLYLAGYFGEGMVEGAGAHRVKEGAHEGNRAAMQREREERKRR